jgi:hypothetical protein
MQNAIRYIHEKDVNTLASSEAIGRVHPIFVGSQTIWHVENSRGLRDEDGYIREYTVTYDKETGFHCRCEAGQLDFTNCRKGYCQHVEAVVGLIREERQALEEQALARSLEAQNASNRVLRGYDIRLARETRYGYDTVIHCWGTPGQLPQEWLQVVNDKRVKRACIHLSSQRARKWGKRQILARFDRSAQPVEAIA